MHTEPGEIFSPGFSYNMTKIHYSYDKQNYCGFIVSSALTIIIGKTSIFCLKILYIFTSSLKSERRTVATDAGLNYIQYCVSAYLFYRVKRQDIQEKQILSANEKYCMAYVGLDVLTEIRTNIFDFREITALNIFDFRVSGSLI